MKTIAFVGYFQIGWSIECLCSGLLWMFVMSNECVLIKLKAFDEIWLHGQTQQTKLVVCVCVHLILVSISSLYFLVIVIVIVLSFFQLFVPGDWDSNDLELFFLPRFVYIIIMWVVFFVIHSKVTLFPNQVLFRWKKKSFQLHHHHHHRREKKDEKWITEWLTVIILLCVEGSGCQNSPPPPQRLWRKTSRVKIYLHHSIPVNGRNERKNLLLGLGCKIFVFTMYES